LRQRNNDRRASCAANGRLPRCRRRHAANTYASQYVAPRQLRPRCYYALASDRTAANGSPRNLASPQGCRRGSRLSARRHSSFLATHVRTRLGVVREGPKGRQLVSLFAGTTIYVQRIQCRCLHSVVPSPIERGLKVVTYVRSDDDTNPPR